MSLGPGDSREQERLIAHGSTRIDATGAFLYRCAVHVGGVGELVFDRARLVECEGVTPELTSAVAPEGTWRSVALTGGRIGALEAPGAHWDGVTVTGTHIGYLSLCDGRVTDTAIEGCQVDALDVTGATLERVRVRGCVVGELVLTRARLCDVDLRGSGLSRVEGILGLAGALSPTTNCWPSRRGWRRPAACGCCPSSEARRQAHHCAASERVRCS